MALVQTTETERDPSLPPNSILKVSISLPITQESYAVPPQGRREKQTRYMRIYFRIYLVHTEKPFTHHSQLVFSVLDFFPIFTYPQKLRTQKHSKASHALFTLQETRKVFALTPGHSPQTCTHKCFHASVRFSCGLNVLTEGNKPTKKNGS